MKLELGMYCYNKINRKSGIGKIIEFRRNNNAVIEYKSGIVLTSIGNIIASHNIIDLIEVGDYVNGYKVLEVTEQYIKLNNPKSNYDCIEFERIFKNKYSNINIFDVVTKEQFNSMKYVVGGE